MTEEKTGGPERSQRCPYRAYNAVFCVMKFHADQHYEAEIPLFEAADGSRASELDSQLFSAADRGDEEKVKDLLTRGADANFLHCAGTPLVVASRRGHIACVQVLLDHGADVNLAGRFNCQTCIALHAAASNGHRAVAELLLEHGADVNSQRDQGSTPLHDAAKFGHLDIAQLLLSKGAPVNVKNSRGKTPLFLAVSEGKLNALRWVLEAVIEYYHYRGYGYNPEFHPRDALEVLFRNEKQVNAMQMSDLQTLRSLLIQNNAEDLQEMMKDRPAADRTRVDLVRTLLEAGSDLEVQDCYESGLLQEAIFNKDCACLKLLLEHGVAVNCLGQKYGNKESPLHMACGFYGNEELTQVLLDGGADVNSLDAYNRTPLHVAAHEGSVHNVQELIVRGARVDVKDKNGSTPLHEAQTLDCAKMLVEHGADPKAVSNCGKSVLFSAADRQGEGACVQYLIEKGADPLKEDCEGNTPLDIALRRWHCESSYDKDDGGLACVKVLIEHGAHLRSNMRPNMLLQDTIRWRRLGHAFAVLRSGAQVNALCGKEWKTALYIAAENNFVAGVQMLLEEGADPNIRCHNTLPLSAALRRGHEEAALTLLDAGARPDPYIYNNIKMVRNFQNLLKKKSDVNRQDDQGMALIHVLSHKLTPSDILVDLLEAGADVNIADNDGTTALHILAMNGSVPHARLLLERKADVNKQDCDGLAPLHYAALKGHTKMAALLLESGADPNVRDSLGRTPAHTAAEYVAETTFLELLLNHGAVVDLKDKLGWTPLHEAVRSEHEDCVKLLVSLGADETVPAPSNREETMFKNILPHIDSGHYAQYDEPPEEDSDSEIDMGFGLFD